MAEPHKMQFYRGVLDDDGLFVCEDGWTLPAVHEPTGEPLWVVVDRQEWRLVPGTELILHGRLKRTTRSRADGATAVEVFQVFVQEELS